MWPTLKAKSDLIVAEQRRIYNDLVAQKMAATELLIPTI